jgi:hypothetical protein
MTPRATGARLGPLAVLVGCDPGQGLPVRPCGRGQRAPAVGDRDPSALAADLEPIAARLVRVLGAQRDVTGRFLGRLLGDEGLAGGEDHRAQRPGREGERAEELAALGRRAQAKRQHLLALALEAAQLALGQSPDAGEAVGPRQRNVDRDLAVGGGLDRARDRDATRRGQLELDGLARRRRQPHRGLADPLAGAPHLGAGRLGGHDDRASDRRWRRWPPRRLVAIAAGADDEDRASAERDRGARRRHPSTRRRARRDRATGRGCRELLDQGPRRGRSRRRVLGQAAREDLIEAGRQDPALPRWRPMAPRRGSVAPSSPAGWPRQTAAAR